MTTRERDGGRGPQDGERVPLVDGFELDALERGAEHRFRLRMASDGFGHALSMPVIVVRGGAPGPVVGLTAALHGNELNGVRVIHRLLGDLDIEDLRGTIVAVPIVNVPGYSMHQREFSDGVDLNRIFPGRAGGTMSQQWAHRFVTAVLEHLDHHIDLHTASFGRTNSLYVRADLGHHATRWMAEAQHPQILVHNTGSDGTLRAAAMNRGIPSITVEVGNPQIFQQRLVRYGSVGVLNILSRLRMLDVEESAPPFEPVVCERSYWIHTDTGGLLEVHPELVQHVREGERIATVTNAYGDVVREYFAPEDGIVIGKSTNPMNQSGSRILHLGIPGDVPVQPADAGAADGRA
jgi:predicted deacylase